MQLVGDLRLALALAGALAVVTNATGTFTGEMTLPDSTVIPPTGKTFDVEFGQTTKWDGDQRVISGGRRYQ